jgi:hypothetical protein
LRAKAYERVTRDVFVMKPKAVDLRVRAEAVKLLFDDAVICLQTSVLLLHMPVDDDGIIHFDRGKAAPRTERAGMKTHRLGIPDARVHDLDGLKVADGPRCLADLSASLDLEALVALGDVVLRRWGPEDIASAVEDHGKNRGAVLLRQSVPMLDKGSDSPAETRSRLRLHAAGFVALKHKVVVRDVGGGWLGEPDLADEVAKVAVQHEGAIHFKKGERQRMKDLARDEVVRQEDWQVVASTAKDDARPELLIAKVTAAYDRAAKLWGRHVLPPHLRD